MEKENVAKSIMLSRLFAEYGRMFTLIAISYTQDRCLAEDIVAESFLSLWERKEDFPVEEKRLPAYTLGIVKHKCMDAIRSRAREQDRNEGNYERILLETRMEVLRDDEQTEMLFRDEIVAIFRKELAAMPALRAGVFSASRIAGKTYKEISEQFGIPVRRVTHEIQKALAGLRKALKDYLK